MEQKKPRVFIGSSREAIPYVNAVHNELSRVAEVTPWTTAFNPMKYTMEDLESQLDQNDFAIFICSPDDIIVMRGIKYLITRDNTLFEMGLFWGKLRRNRVFFLIPNKTRDIRVEEDEELLNYHLLSDLIGINPLTYEIRNIENYKAAVSVACNEIKEIISQEGLYTDYKVLFEEALEREEQLEAITFFALKLTKALIQSSNEKVYDYLIDALRSVYAILPGFNIEGVGVWEKVGNDGLRHMAGLRGRVSFYPFTINKGKEQNETDRIYVIDSFLKNEEIIEITKEHLFKTYLICYPIANKFVLTVTVTGSKRTTKEETAIQMLWNKELINTIDFLFGGGSR